MKIFTKITLGLLLAVAVLLTSSHAPAKQSSKGDQPSDAKKEPPAAAPDLADIVPLATELTGRLAAIQNRVKGGLDISATEKKYDGIEENLKGLTGQLQRLKDSKDPKYNKLVALREAIKQENNLLQEISKPVGQEIRQLGALRKEWLAEKKRWNELRSSLFKEGELHQLKATFKKANDTIETALNLVLPQLEAALKAQEKGGSVQVKIKALNADLDGLIGEELRSTVLDDTPPMLSSRFFFQFRGSELWSAVAKGAGGISLPDSRFFAGQGWIIFLKGFLSLVLIIALYRNRRLLSESERWRFLGARPVSAGLFLVYMTTMVIYEYEGAPPLWKLSNMTVAGISFARLMGGMIEASWKRQFVYGLVIFCIVTRLMDVLSFPVPLFRLYTILTALAGLLFFLRWVGESRRVKDSAIYAGSLRLGSLIFAFIVIAELWGKKALAAYLFISLTDSMATVLVFILFMYMIHVGLEWLFRTSLLRKTEVLSGEDADAIARRVSLFLNVSIGLLVLLPAVLITWGGYNSLEGATKGLLALGFKLGSQRITVGLVMVSAGVLYGSYFLSWIITKLLTDDVLLRRRVERGVRVSIARLVHYLIVFLGFLLAVSTLGFDVTKLTIMLSALGVGIGFGLQGVVNNFVSGLILLFERPVRTGDYVEVGGTWAEIKRIGLRATTVQTFDNADLIIPNGDLVNNQVTNWTLSSRKVRLTVQVGVSYGSNVSLVMEILMACADENSMVSKTPEPQVLFLNFGESSLDFELRVWVLDTDQRLLAKSELHQEIDRRFREANIEIAFPQRDLHLRSVDESVRMVPHAAPSA